MDMPAARPGSPQPALDGLLGSRQPRILVVMGDSALRNSTRTLLGAYSCHLTLIATPAEALLYAGGGAHVDLLVTNYYGAAAQQLVARLRDVLGPSLKALMISASLADPLPSSLSADPLVRVAIQPDCEQLLSQLRALLLLD